MPKIRKHVDHSHCCSGFRVNYREDNVINFQSPVKDMELNEYGRPSSTSYHRLRVGDEGASRVHMQNRVGATAKGPQYVYTYYSFVHVHVHLKTRDTERQYLFVSTPRSLCLRPADLKGPTSGQGKL